MPLITRLSRLFRADFHAVLDRMEDPETLLRQTVREMEEQLGAEAHSADQIERQHAAARAQRSALENNLRELEQELDVCFESSQEALARSVIRRRLELAQKTKALESRTAELQDRLQRTRERIAVNRTRLDELRHEAELSLGFGGRASNAGGALAPEPEMRFCVSEEAVEVAFLRERRKRDQQ